MARAALLRQSVRRSLRAFSLMELLIVTAIIGLLMALVLPGLQVARAAAEQIRCMSNLRQLGVGSHLYASEHRDAVLPAYYDGRLWHDVLFNGDQPHSSRGVLPDPFAYDNAHYQGQTWIQHCPSNPYRVSQWRDASYTVNYALSGWSSDPSHELARHGNPGTRWLQISSLTSPSRIIQLTDAAVAGKSGEPAGSLIAPTHLLAWRDRPGFDWHRGQLNLLALDGHVQRLGESGYQEQLDANRLFWRRNHVDWW